MSRETWGAIDRTLWGAMTLIILPLTVLSIFGVLHMPALVFLYVGWLATRYCYSRWTEKVDSELTKREIWERIQRQRRMFENPHSVNYGVYSNVSPSTLEKIDRPFWKRL